MHKLKLHYIFKLETQAEYMSFVMYCTYDNNILCVYKFAISPTSCPEITAVYKKKIVALTIDPFLELKKECLM